MASVKARADHTLYSGELTALRCETWVLIAVAIYILLQTVVVTASVVLTLRGAEFSLVAREKYCDPIVFSALGAFSKIANSHFYCDPIVFFGIGSLFEDSKFAFLLRSHSVFWLCAPLRR